MPAMMGVAMMAVAAAALISRNAVVAGSAFFAIQDRLSADPLLPPYACRVDCADGNATYSHYENVPLAGSTLDFFPPSCNDTWAGFCEKSGVQNIVAIGFCEPAANGGSCVDFAESPLATGASSTCVTMCTFLDNATAVVPNETSAQVDFQLPASDEASCLALCDEGSSFYQACQGSTPAISTCTWVPVASTA